MRKKPVIRTESYVTKNGQLVRFDDLTLEEKRIAATELKLRYLRAMFGAGGLSLVSEEFLYAVRSYGMVLLLAAAASTPLGKAVLASVKRKEKGEQLIHLAEPAAAAVLLLLSTAYLVDGSFSPFLYFRF